jgi:hypothetical protein
VGDSLDSAPSPEYRERIKEATQGRLANHQQERTMPRPTALAYIRQNLTMPGENFVIQWGKLTDQDKADLKAHAESEMDLLNVTA